VWLVYAFVFFPFALSTTEETEDAGKDKEDESDTAENGANDHADCRVVGWGGGG
jgi:hypothetical protein